jgi:hypothetical protein
VGLICTLLESDLNRLTLYAECEHLREAASWVGRIKDAQRKLSPWALVLAPLAGVALALGLRRSSSGAGFLARALALAPSLIEVWRTFSSPSNEPK